MGDAPPPDSLASPNSLAHALAPALREACAGRLGEIRWFRSDWQRGGAATGVAEWLDPGQPPREVVVKLPVGPTEHRFTVALAESDAPTPRIAAHGLELGGYDLAWLVMERLPGEPLHRERDHKPVVCEIAAACAAFHAAAAKVRASDNPPPSVPWDEHLDKARHAARDSDIPEQQKWNDAIKHVQRHLPALLAKWRARDRTTWKHGDLHPANAMRRPDGSPWGRSCCVLIDLALVTLGHWVEDAVYLERLYWGHMDALHGEKPVKLLAKARKELGLENGEDYAELANIRRVLMAATSPAFLKQEGGRAHLHGSLLMLEKTLPLVIKH